LITVANSELFIARAVNGGWAGEKILIVLPAPLSQFSLLFVKKAQDKA